MKPTLELFKKSMPDINEELLEAHYNRLGSDYFRRFSEDHIRRHVQAISRLSQSHPVELIIDRIRDDETECTVLAFDYPGEFSLITGILAGSGFNVMSGDVYTYMQAGDGDAKTARKKFPLSPRVVELHRRKIIDFFSGGLINPLYFEEWADQFKKNLEAVIGLLEAGDAESLQNARNHVNEMVVNHLSNIQSKGFEPVLFPVEIDISNNGPFTQLKIVSEDTPAPGACEDTHYPRQD
jgi:hypothetical protein